VVIAVKSLFTGENDDVHDGDKDHQEGVFAQGTPVEFFPDKDLEDP